MVYAKYRLSDSVFLCSWTTKPDYDPATEGIQEFPEHLRPDLRSERHDAESRTGKRPATAEELAAYEAAKLDERARVSVEQDIDSVALVTFIARHFGIAVETAQDEIVTIQKELRSKAAGVQVASDVGIEDPVRGL
jgi:hypothetical protein